MEWMSQQAGLYTIYGSLDTDLSVSAILDVLTDYRGLARIYNNIQESRLVFQGAQKQVHQVKLQISALRHCSESGMQLSVTCTKVMCEKPLLAAQVCRNLDCLYLGCRQLSRVTHACNTYLHIQ